MCRVNIPEFQPTYFYLTIVLTGSNESGMILKGFSDVLLTLSNSHPLMQVKQLSPGCFDLSGQFVREAEEEEFPGRAPTLHPAPFSEAAVYILRG